MLIQPNSTINILKNVPLDNTYNHTLWFDNVASQTTYFASMTKYTFPVQSYQRVNRGVMRLNRKADDIYDCNYLMFQNTSYGNKWFYAFITAIEYVNDATCEITFSIDPMQTYLFDIELKMCFVEREHSSTDVAGDNIVDEPVKIGDLVCNKIEKLDNMENYTAMIWHAGLNTGDTPGGTYSQMFSGLDMTSTAATATGTLIQLLKDFTDNNKADAIVSLVMMPTRFFRNDQYISNEDFSTNYPTSIAHGYVPRNKKLLTYPYNYMVVDCGNDTGIYRYEWFGQPSGISFNIYGYTCPNPQIVLFPNGYNGTHDSVTGEVNFTEALVMEGFPQLPFAIDGYRAYLAQSSAGSKLNALEDVIQTSNSREFVGGKNGTPTGYERFMGKAPIAQNGVVSNLVSGLQNLFTSNTGNENYDTFTRSTHSAKHPNGSRGSFSAGYESAFRIKNFYFKQMTVAPNYARVIDDFFDMFGYATNRIKVPNRTVRPHWNYVKTNGCDVVGNAPADDIRAVCKIYDNGITFWKNPSEVGNYSLNNSL